MLSKGIIQTSYPHSPITAYLHRLPLLRLDIGGKLLTNHLKELVSYRQWNLMDETYIINDVKETCCYVSLDFVRDLEVTRYVFSSRFKPGIPSHANTSANPRTNRIVQEYILPDTTKQPRGHIRKPSDLISDSDQLLVMNNERFSVPEIVFRPNDIGIGFCLSFFLWLSLFGV